MKYLKCLLPAVLIAGMAGTAVFAQQETANKIKSVFVVDYLTVEVVMEKPLTEKETNPLRMTAPDFQPDFTFNEGVHMSGMPILQESDGFHENTYRIPVTGLDEGVIYRISYKGQKEKTFKAYSGRELEEKYRNRYGSYF